MTTETYYRMRWSYAGALLALGAVLAAIQDTFYLDFAHVAAPRKRSGRHGKFGRFLRLGTAWHYLVGFARGEDSAVTSRFLRVLGRTVLGAAVVALEVAVMIG